MSAGGAPLTLGTAGHVDHGKTALVRALTGVDTDRLPQERARGLSIELGYAALELPGAGPISLIDVPGHERFVRTMVAGATGIDMFLMAIAADDGVMPQTREHAAVLRALHVEHGVVAVTKADLTDPARALAEAGELMPGISAVACAAPTGEGLAALREAIARVAAELRGRARSDGPPAPLVLHVDRVFTIRGAGTVVTGTLWSGVLRPGDAVRLMPSGETVRVRGVQVHDAAVQRADAGQRVALNLAGVSTRGIARGDVVCGNDAALTPTTVLDARLELPGAAHNERVQLHHGTRDVPARLADLGDGFWQLRLEAPVLAGRGDRVVIRRVAPPDTLGGGEIVDPVARRHGRAGAHRERLAGAGGVLLPEAPRPAPAPPSAPDSREPGPELTRVAERLRAAGHEPPSRTELGDDAALVPALLAAGLAVRIGRDRYAHPDALAAVRERLPQLAAADADGLLTLPALRDALHTSRQFAQALLEHFDATRVTRRLPDNRRRLRRAAQPSTGPSHDQRGIDSPAGTSSADP